MRFRKGQNLLEYVMLLCIIVSSILIMQTYVKRAYQGRLKQESDSLGQQYSPDHTTSYTVASTSVVSETYMGGTTDASGLAGIAVDVPDGMSVTFSQSNTGTTHKEAVDSFATE